MPSNRFTYHQHTETNPTAGKLRLPVLSKTDPAVISQRVISDCLDRYQFNPMLKLSYRFNLFVRGFGKR